jgi:serine protease AprX
MPLQSSKTRIFRGLAVLSLLLVGTVGIPSQSQDKISVRLREHIQREGVETIRTVWIFLDNKGPDPEAALDAAEAALSPRSRLRRMRSVRLPDALVDHYDIPVFQPYVARIRPLVRRIRHTSRWLNAVSVEVRGRSLEELSALPFVRHLDVVGSYSWREPVSSPLYPSDAPIRSVSRHSLDYGDSLNQLAQMRVPELHDMGLSGKGILICMLDAGFNTLDHEALDHLDILATWDFVNNDPLVFDETGQMGNGNHGTETLSTIAGYQPGTLIGPAYQASFLLGKTENTEWERHLEEDHWVAGAEWADAQGADIISSSVGYSVQFTDGEADYSWQEMDGRTTIITQGANIAANRGILILNSAGNEGDRPFPVNSLIAPSDSEYVLAVGAVGPFGSRVGFSSVGPTADGRIKPDIMAQGYRVVSAVPNARDAYALVDGTSFSCPLAAGAAALVLEANPTWSNLDLIQALKSTAGSADNPDNKKGWGIVDAAAAVGYETRSLFPPKQFNLTRLLNDYIFFAQWVDRLSWAPNPLSEVPVQGYRLYYRPAGSASLAYVLLVELDADTLSFDRRGLLLDEAFAYKITAVDETGAESEGAFTSGN